jgi:8-oxo-dGTP pyrophosphatase MutT (NUDIX family)
VTIQQASAIPFRLSGEGPEVCLITSLRSGAWGFPKGAIEPGETTEEAALKEAFEEAGLHGRIASASLGRYRYEKWGNTLEVDVFLMAVETCCAEWQEMELRQRRWVALSNLTQFDIRRPPPKILNAALRLIGEHS